MSSRCGAIPVLPLVTRVLLAVALLSSAGTTADAAQASRQPGGLEVPADTSVVQELELSGGTKLIGRIVEIAHEQVTFLTLEGVEVTVPVAQVVAVRVLEGRRRGSEFWPRDRSDSRLFIGPTARVVGHGRGYAGIYELLFPSAAIGIGNVAMVSGGMSIFPGLPLRDQFFFISPKLRLIGSEHIGAAAGVFWLALGDSDESAGLVYSVVTAESATAAITLGPAFPFFSDGGFTDEVLGMIGAEVRIFRTVKFINENWFAQDGEGAFLTFGFRALQGSGSGEVAVLIPSDADGFLPIINLTLYW